MSIPRIRRLLTRWYAQSKRDLPWRATSDPYAIWVSEVMLQQTRVAAAIPYYERFLARFPTVAALAAAPGAGVLAAWNGLGYYTRARNLHRAAQAAVAAGGLPRDYAGLRALPGIGDYTAAAVASIAYGLPYAAVDGNIRRVLARLSRGSAEDLLDRHNPGDWNQALMELGATICLPREPRCAECPLEPCCAKRQTAPRTRRVPERIARTLVVVRRGRHILCRKEGDFWELPESVPGATHPGVAGVFRHTITQKRYTFTLLTARLHGPAPAGLTWRQADALLSTVARKALACAGPALQGCPRMRPRRAKPGGSR